MVQMKIRSSWIPRLFNFATSLASARRFSSTARPLLDASGTRRRRPSALVPHDSASFPPAVSPSRRVSRFPHRYQYMTSSSGVQGEDLRKPPSAKNFIISLAKHSENTQGMENVETADTTKVITRYSYLPPASVVEDERRASRNVVFGDEDAYRKTLEVMDSKPDTSEEIVDISGYELSSVDKESWAVEVPDYPMEDVPTIDILPNSSHRDGSIYSGTQDWKRSYHIADRNETRLEAMMFSDPTDCFMYDGECASHSSRHMFQILSLRLAKIPVEHDSVQLYGYIAVRDYPDTSLNYIVNVSKDDPIIVEQGSLINMAGPKRGIQFISPVLIEYDMKIKTGEHGKEDLQLIDGVSHLDPLETSDCSPFTLRIQGDCGAIDIGASRLSFSVEATIEVVISQVQTSFSMHLGCFTSGLHEEIRLFDGSIGESCGLKRSVVAVQKHAQMELKFKVAVDPCIPAEYCCSFEANKHGRATQEIKTGFALIAVKVTWSTLEEL
ncbi:uncharacterized protein LOC124654544 [Lolium rigidum]|uniref:uncharacterized protein LOC124654544 n=1 Tax=Lolium rigidum TaxID=89674 RepID=UPI001F5D8CC3|nr:uncharacterized protein LOC124654544 [Lolium rigidum]